MPEVAHTGGSSGDEFGDPRRLRQLGQCRAEPGDAAGDGRPLVRGPDRDRGSHQAGPVLLGTSVGQGTVQHQATHRVPDED